MIIAETPRLVISKFEVSDAPFFLELVNTPTWLTYIGDRGIKTIEHAEERIKEGHLKSYENYGFGFYKVLLKEENLQPIGTAGLIKREALDDVDIGFALLPGYEGNGFGYESAAEILTLAEHAFKLQRVAAITLPTNESSIKLLKKLGLKYEKKVVLFEDDEELLLFAKNLVIPS